MPADDAFFRQMGITRPGDPATPGPAPGPQPTRPPAPPSATADLGGRPALPRPIAPAPAAAASPGAPGAPGFAARPPAGSPGPTPPPTGETKITTTLPHDPATGQPTAPQPAPRQVVQHPRVPSTRELQGLGDADVMTPYGPVVRDPMTGKTAVHLTPEGKMQYGADVAAARTRLGPHPFAADVAAPKLDVRPGYPMFNPFTNSWRT